jgi:hypothetical protein
MRGMKMKVKNPRSLFKLEVLPGTNVAYFSRREAKLKTGRVLCLKVYADYVGNIRTKVFVGLSKEEAGWSCRRRWVDYGSLKVLRKGYNDQLSWQDVYTEETKPE